MDEIIGFTGTRRQPSQLQIGWLRLYLRRDGVKALHHGACIGADAFAHMLAYQARIPIVVHPPVNQRFMYMASVERHHLPLVTVLPAKPYLQRNRNIVDACDRLIALPDGPPRARSGTWYSIDYAEFSVPVTICWPDGRIETR